MFEQWWRVISSVQINFFYIFLVLAFLIAGFIFWWRLHQSANYNEFEIFDLFLAAILGGFIFARLFFVLLHWPQFGNNFASWFNFINVPGFNPLAFVIGSSLSLKFFLTRRKIANLEILDFFVQAVCFGLIFYHLGLFVVGENNGFITQSPLGGWQMKNLQIKTHPVSLYTAIFYLGLYFYLNYLEKNYRTYNWYRGNRNSAQPGFLFFSFTIIASLFSLLKLSLQPAQIFYQNFSLDWLVYLLTFLTGLIMLYRRSSFYGRKKKS